MLVDRVETFRAYRDTLRRRFDQASHAALEPIPEGGEWDGIQVIRRAELERVIADFAKADPDPLPTVAEVSTPARIFVDAICPQCGIPARVLVEVHTVLEVYDDGRSIKAKARSKASSHVCGQMPLEVGADADQLTLDVRTEPTLVLRHDVPRPEDATLGLPSDERCGAETTIPASDPDGEAAEETLVCERVVDHDAIADESGRDHWSEGGFAWHFEERPALEVLPDPVAGDEEEDGA